MLTRLIDTIAVPLGEGRPVQIEGKPVLAVFNVEGQFFVTNDKCTHGKASLSEGWLEDFEVCCPVHDGRFDLRDGRPLCFPVTEALPTYACQVEDGAVWADITNATAEAAEDEE